MLPNGSIDSQLYAGNVHYRELVDRLYRVEQELGAMISAYANAIADQKRIKTELIRNGGSWHDDPGYGGSGGSGQSR